MGEHRRGDFCEGCGDAWPCPGSGQARPEVLAEDYRLHAKGLDLDGQPFPWWVADDGPRIESRGANCPYHLLWIPVLVNKPAPGYWDDRGEPLTSTEPSAEGAME